MPSADRVQQFWDTTALGNEGPDGTVVQPRQVSDAEVLCFILGINCEDENEESDPENGGDGDGSNVPNGVQPSPDVVRVVDGGDDLF